jgi:toxin YoeB
VSWQVVFSKHAQKDAQKLVSAGLKPKAQELLAILTVDPFQNPPSYEKLVGDLAGACSRRINIQHRLVYEVFNQERTVRVLRMWSHWASASRASPSAAAHVQVVSCAAPLRSRAAPEGNHSSTFAEHGDADVERARAWCRRPPARRRVRRPVRTGRGERPSQASSACGSASASVKASGRAPRRPGRSG